MGLLRLYVDLTARKLVASQKSTAGYGMPAMVYGDVMSLEVMLLQPAIGAGINSPYSIIDISSIGLQVGIGTPGGTPAALQNTWTKIEGNTVFSGAFNLNTAGIAALLGSNSQVNSTFEIEVDSAGDTDTPIQISVTLKKPVISAGAPTPIPGTEYLTTTTAAATYARLYGNPGQTITLISENGLWGRTLGVDDSGNPTDDTFAI